MLFIGCSSDDDVIKEQEPLNIYGTWNSISFIANQTLFDVNGDGVNSLELLDELPCRYSKLVLNEDLTFYQENNSYSYNENTNNYECSSGDAISPVTGTYTVNPNFSRLYISVGDGHTAFLDIEFDGETLMFNSSEIFLNKNAEGESKNISGKVLFHRN